MTTLLAEGAPKTWTIDIVSAVIAAWCLVEAVLHWAVYRKNKEHRCVR